MNSCSPSPLFPLAVQTTKRLLGLGERQCVRGAPKFIVSCAFSSWGFFSLLPSLRLLPCCNYLCPLSALIDLFHCFFFRVFFLVAVSLLPISFYEPACFFRRCCEGLSTLQSIASEGAMRRCFTAAANCSSLSLALFFSFFFHVRPLQICLAAAFATVLAVEWGPVFFC